MDERGKPLSQFKLERLRRQESVTPGAGAGGSNAAPIAAPALPRPPAPVIPSRLDSAGLAHDASSTRSGAAQRRTSETEAKGGGDGSVIAKVPARSVAPAPAGREETIEEKVDRYSKFVDEKLRVKLAQVLEQREEVVKEIEAYEKLRGTVEVMRESGSSRAKSMINVACELYMQASIPDTSKIMVNIGLGFFVELTLAEAADFIQQRCDHLQERADKLSHEASEVNGQIEVVLRGLQELVSTLSTS